MKISNKLIAIIITICCMIFGNTVWAQWTFSCNITISGNCPGDLSGALDCKVGRAVAENACKNVPLEPMTTQTDCENNRQRVLIWNGRYGIKITCTPCICTSCPSNSPNATGETDYSNPNMIGLTTGSPFVTSHQAFENEDFINQASTQYNLINSRGNATYYNGVNVTGDKNFDNEWSKLNGRQGAGQYFDYGKQNNTEPYTAKKGFDAMAELGKSSGVNLSDYISESDYNKFLTNAANMTSQERADFNKKIDQYQRDANEAINAKIQEDLNKGTDFTIDSKTSGKVVDLSEVENLENIKPKIFEQPLAPDLPSTIETDKQKREEYRQKREQEKQIFINILVENGINTKGVNVGEYEPDKLYCGRGEVYYEDERNVLEQIFVSQKANFSCFVHDRQYAIKRFPKEEADEIFKNNIILELKKIHGFNDSQARNAAQIYYDGVRLFGQNAYNNAQNGIIQQNSTNYYPQWDNYEGINEKPTYNINSEVDMQEWNNIKESGLFEAFMDAVKEYIKQEMPWLDNFLSNTETGIDSYNTAMDLYEGDTESRLLDFGSLASDHLGDGGAGVVRKVLEKGARDWSKSIREIKDLALNGKTEEAWKIWMKNSKNTSNTINNGQIEGMGKGTKNKLKKGGL